MAKKKGEPMRFAVIGRGQFPLDMLRYDRACPWQERDSALMQQETCERVVIVEAFGHSAPTFARWASFGWCAVLYDEWESREAVANRLLAQKALMGMK